MRSLRQYVDAVTSGSFGERIVHHGGAWWHEIWHQAGVGSSSGRSRVRSSELAALREQLGSDDVGWASWPR